MAQDIDQQSKQSGFNQDALDQMVRQCFANAQFEVNVEEGLDLVGEFYTEEMQNEEVEQTQPATTTRTKKKPKPNQGNGFVQDIQKRLHGSVDVVS